jgi:hypothetical protein
MSTNEKALDTLNTIMKSEPVNAGFTNQILAKTPLLNLLLQKTIKYVDGGLDIKVGVRGQEFTGGHWSGKGNVVADVSTVQTFSATGYGFATYNWSFYNAPVKIENDKWQLVIQGKYAMEDLAETTLSDLADSVARHFEKLIFTGYKKTITGSADANRLAFGLQEIVDTGHVIDGSDTWYIGGINESTYTWWKSPIYDFAEDFADRPLPIVFYNILTDMTDLYGTPDIIVTTHDIFMKYVEELYGKTSVNTKDEVATKLGFSEGVGIDGVPLVYSRYCPAQTAFFLNTKYLNYVFAPNQKFVVSDFQPISRINRDLIAFVDALYSVITDNRQAHAKLIHIA